MDNDIQTCKIAGMEVVCIYPDQASKKKMVYLCGGAYFQQLGKRHWEFLDRLLTVSKKL
ncbi:hypothetical protein [Limosilactobacillus mucosae]|uniref:hypothetical protein n=1 Tax=Limosilactobacillus mucosae TaxID=97478 RepID=UPI0022E1D26E|nr:hypothetical protein [Limosilactobacillus mucosae]